jgi:hypothetical protein
MYRRRVTRLARSAMEALYSPQQYQDKNEIAVAGYYFISYYFIAVS